MPCIDNFQALVSITTPESESYAIEHPLPKKTLPSTSAFYSRTMIQAAWGASYRIVFGMIDPLASPTDMIVYVLVDGNLIASRILRNQEGESSDHVTGMSLNENGFGPLRLLPKEENGLHFAESLPPSSSGEVKLLVYRGQAIACDEPSLFSYPSFVCPLIFCRNPYGGGRLEVEGITGFGPPRSFDRPLPEKRFNFISDDPWPSPYIVVSFLTCSPTQIRNHLEVSHELSRPSRPFDLAVRHSVSPSRQRTTSLAELDTQRSPSDPQIVRPIPIYRDPPFIAQPSGLSQPQSNPIARPRVRLVVGPQAAPTLLSAPIFSPDDRPPLSVKSPNIGNAATRLTALSRKRRVEEIEGSENAVPKAEKEKKKGKKGKSKE